MKIKSRLGDAYADRTEGQQINLRRSAFNFRRVSSTVRVFSLPCLKVNSFDCIFNKKRLTKGYQEVYLRAIDLLEEVGAIHLKGFKLGRINNIDEEN
ncbi:hypothetical protein [Streptococcus thoraltensis]|uniref:hypothetical protein n=1 Tax=Streptococcus thoraltensis TaxID=55085 RepID=UPI002A824822|nr:hypothetical protein [Streptococcus thoraltensis]